MLSSNSRSLDFEPKALFIMINKKIIINDKASNIFNTTPLSYCKIPITQGGEMNKPP